MIALAGIAIQSKIYESSASLVYRGIRVQDELKIVVKMLKQNYPSPQEVTRYRQEYEITRSLKEQGVVKAYSQQEYQRTLVILLEDFGGESLERWMQQCPEIFCPMPLSAFLRLAIDLTDILGRIHAANIIHKDINPGNIVFNPDTGVVKFIDFGIATQFNRTNSTFKSHYVLEGTLAYLSPEQTGRMNRLLDYRTDFYSLGVTFYELLTGQLPFPTTDILELVHCHIAKQPPPPHALNARIPRAVSDIILKLMAKNAEERYQSAWGIKADLEICAQQLAQTGQIGGIQLARQDVCDQFQISQKLYGRDQEVAILLAAFLRVASLEDNAETTLFGEQTSSPIFKVEMMLVSGFAGIGKSALVQEIHKPITAKRGYFISGKFDQLKRNIPYSGIVDALQKLVQQLLGEPDNQVQQWRSRLLTALGNNGQIIIDVIPEVELIIGKQPPVPEVGATRVLGQLFEAEEFYEQAIQGAKDNEYLQEEALVYELAAKFYLFRGREKFAQTYIKEAHYCYELWGATAKVRDLETRYPQFFSQSSNNASQTIPKSSKTTSNRSPIAFDLAAVLKASQAISNQIELEQLLSCLMKILIENAGAQTGFLILQKAGEWVIEASGELNNSDRENVYSTQVLQSIPTANHLPESIINYVIRTHECVILNDASREENFVNEPYIQHNQTKSIFCLPLLNQGQLVGVLYLENQLAAGAFTPERSQVLNLLSTQAAIAIENARLYSKLRASESQMAQFLEAVPVGISVVDTTGYLYYLNGRAIQLLGKGIDPSVTPDQISKVYQLYLTGTDQQYPTEELPGIRALRGERTRIDDLEIHQNNVTIPVEVWGTPVFDEQGNVAYAIATFQDITERKQTEQLLADYNRTLEQQVVQRTAALQASEAALRVREQELRLITDALPVCICYVDANQRYRFANRTYEIWFSCSRDEILGKSVRELLGEAAYQVEQPYINRALSGQMTTYEAEIPYLFGKKYISATFIPDFDYNPQASTSLLPDCDHEVGALRHRHTQVKGYYGLITDISEQRNAALRERKLAEEASIIEERNRMAREIHDTLAQAFTSIIIHLEAASLKIKTDLEATQAILKTGRDLARSGLTEARRSVESLRPQALENHDLYSALQQLAKQMFLYTQTQVICNRVGSAYLLESVVENNLLRIGQEALNNAFKYAKAREVRVEFVYQPSQFILRIKDNGQGFMMNNHTIGGFGLLGMTERAGRIGAQLTIGSAPGRGTEIVVSVNPRERS